MRVLVTGAAGFIGGAIARALVARGDDVTGLDDMSNGRPERVPPGSSFIEASVCDPTLAERLGPPYDLIVHCAAQISVHRSMIDPARDREVNLLGTANLLAAVAPSRPRFVFFSTGGAIYGERTSPATEDSPLRPLSFYGVHKLAAEGYVVLSGLSHAILRPANVFGPGQRSDTEGGVVSIFLERLRAGEAIRINGDGQQLRDYVFIDDVVAAVLALASSDVQGAFNLGTGRTTSLLDLVETLEGATRRTANVELRPSRPADLRYSCLDATRLTATGLWQPRASLGEGLSAMVRFFPPFA